MLPLHLFGVDLGRGWDYFTSVGRSTCTTIFRLSATNTIFIQGRVHLFLAGNLRRLRTARHPPRGGSVRAIRCRGTGPSCHDSVGFCYVLLSISCACAISHALQKSHVSDRQFGHRTGLHSLSRITAHPLPPTFLLRSSTGRIPRSVRSKHYYA